MHTKNKVHLDRKSHGQDFFRGSLLSLMRVSVATLLQHKVHYTLSEQFYLVQFRETHNILFLMQHRCWQIELLSLIKSYVYSHEINFRFLTLAY